MNAPDSQPTGSFVGAAFRLYGPGLRDFLLRRMKRSQDAEDVVQEVFMRLLRIRRAELVRNPRAYLYGIALHVVREFRLRAERTGTWMTVEPEALESLTERPDDFAADGIPERLDLERQLEKALEALPSMQLSVLLLHKRDGYSYEEIAEKLGLSVNTVDKYLVQAKVRLRTMEWDR
jgi:RNA polymerase sigma factor (sigma-70 family)